MIDQDSSRDIRDSVNRTLEEVEDIHFFHKKHSQRQEETYYHTETIRSQENAGCRAPRETNISFMDNKNISEHFKKRRSRDLWCMPLFRR